MGGSYLGLFLEKRGFNFFKILEDFIFILINYIMNQQTIRTLKYNDSFLGCNAFQCVFWVPVGRVGCAGMVHFVGLLYAPQAMKKLQAKEEEEKAKKEREKKIEKLEELPRAIYELVGKYLYDPNLVSPNEYIQKVAQIGRTTNFVQFKFSLIVGDLKDVSAPPLLPVSFPRHLVPSWLC